MSKEGAIILGIGGDNSVSAQGTFYEGVMTSGYPSDATENSVQANIVAAEICHHVVDQRPGAHNRIFDLAAGNHGLLYDAVSCTHRLHRQHPGRLVI